MSTQFDNLRDELYDKICDLYTIEQIPEDFRENFFKLISKVNFMLIEDKDNFYGYFLLQMAREIKYDITTPTAVNFQLSKYVIYFNPLIFLQLSLEQMMTTIKHEIHHILALHLTRAKELRKKYSTIAVNIAMDIVVNQYLNHLPPYATTIEWINLKYNLHLKPYMALEYYVVELQKELDLLHINNESEEDDTKENNEIERNYDISKTHDLWDKSIDIEDKTAKDLTEKIVSKAEMGTAPLYIESILKRLKEKESEIPWDLYLRRLMGTLESDRKKTITRRNRRQPERLDLRGDLRGHTVKIAVAMDISGSVSKEEFNEAMKEVLNIVKNYKHEITVLECDSEIRQAYKVKSITDLRERYTNGGATKFSPVFSYVNKTDTNLLIYFTDGQGESRLTVTPKGYKVLWIISGRGDALSLSKPFGIIKRLKPVEIKTDSVDLLDLKTEGWSMNSQQPII